MMALDISHGKMGLGKGLSFCQLARAGETARLLAEAGALYAEALETGYRGALRLDGGCVDARAGAAEALVALGKLAAAGAPVKARCCALTPHAAKIEIPGFPLFTSQPPEVLHSLFYGAMLSMHYSSACNEWALRQRCRAL